MAKFFFFEKIVSLFYTHVFTEPKESYAKTTQLGVTFASGYLAGVVCAIVSHPADSVVSLMGKPANKGKGIGQIASETGMVALATKGLGTRVLMIGTLTGEYLGGVAIVRCCDTFLRLPMVDLRHLQVIDGSRHHRRQVSFRIRRSYLAAVVFYFHLPSVRNTSLAGGGSHAIDCYQCHDITSYIVRFIHPFLWLSPFTRLSATHSFLRCNREQRAVYDHTSHSTKLLGLGNRSLNVRRLSGDIEALILPAEA